MDLRGVPREVKGEPFQKDWDKGDNTADLDLISDIRRHIGQQRTPWVAARSWQKSPKQK